MALLKNKFKIKKYYMPSLKRAKQCSDTSTFKSGKWGEHYEHEE